jgi:hypothetical protein
MEHYGVRIPLGIGTRVLLVAETEKLSTGNRLILGFLGR